MWYFITAENRSTFMGQLRDVVQSGQESKHRDLHPPCIIKDEQAVSAVVEVIRGWNNPFSDNQELVSISKAI